MGGTMKKIHAASNMSSSNNRSRKWNVYLLILFILLVFGAATLGVMGLHRLKDRRIFNLLIKEKDTQIISLHQKEREHAQEYKKKTEEMKIKIYNLRSQKAELNGRMLELQSIISSLKEELRTIELAFQEKQNEVKLLKERYIDVKDQNPQVKALTEMLHQKEAEIMDLKHRLQLPDKVQGISAHDPSRLPKDRTAKGNLPGMEIMNNQSQQKRRDIQEDSSNHEERKNPTDSVVSNTNSVSRNDEQKPRDGDSESRFVDNKEFTTTGETQSRISNPQGSENEELGMHKNGMKLGMQENSYHVSYRLGGKHSYLKRVKSKRWRLNAKEKSGNNVFETMKDQRLIKGTEDNGNRLEKESKPINQDKIQDLRMDSKVQNEYSWQNQQKETDDKFTDGGQGSVKAILRGYNEETNGETSEDSPPGMKLENSTKPMDAEVMRQNVATAEPNEMPKYATIRSEDIGSSNEGTVQHPKAHGQSNEEEIIIRHYTENRNNDDNSHRHGITEADEKNEELNKIEVDDFEETKLGTGTPTEDREEGKEWTNQPEF